MKLSKLFSILLALNFVSCMLLTVPASASTSSVTIVTTPSDAVVTLNGVTKQAYGGMVTFDIAAGTYDCQVSKTGYIWQEGTLTVSGNAAYSVTLEEDTENSHWTFDNDTEGWYSHSGDSVVQSDGALVISMTTADPIILKDEINLDLTNRDKIYLTYKKTTPESEIYIYFKNETLNHSGSTAFKKSLPTTSTYVTEVFDNNVYFNGTLVNLRIDPIPTATGLTDAKFYIDKVEIPLTAPLTLTEKSTVTFNVLPADATVTFNGMTQQAHNGVAVFPATDGTYDCLVSKTGYIWQQGEINVTAGKTYAVTLLEDSTNSYWTFDNDTEGWYSHSGDSVAQSDGALVISMTTADPIILKDEINLDLTNRDKIYLTYKKTTPESEIYIYFKNETLNHSGSTAFKKSLPTTSTYVTEVFDNNVYFNGTLVNLRIDPIPTATGLTDAKFYIDKVEIPLTAPLTLTENSMVTFNVLPETATVAVYSNNGELVASAKASGGITYFALPDGSYTYTANKIGYNTAEGSFSVNSMNCTVEVTLTEKDSIYSYDFTEKTSAEQILNEGWTISDTSNVTLSPEHGIQTGSPGVQNSVGFILDDTIDSGKINLTLDVMGITPVSGGYFDSSIRPSANSVGFSFFSTGDNGDILRYLIPGESIQNIEGNYDLTGEHHTLSFLLNLDLGAIKIKHDGVDILPGGIYAGNSFAGIWLHFKPDCEFYLKSVNITRTDEEILTEPPVWIDCETEPGDFSIAVLPDTQILPNSFPDTLSLMAQWALTQQNDNLKYVISVGDITGNNTEKEWENVKNRFGILDGEIPLAMVPGNHDYNGIDPAANPDPDLVQPYRDTARYNNYYSYEKVSTYPTFGGAYEEGKTDNTYHCFKEGNLKYLILCLECHPRDSVVEWANDVVASHPDYNVIVNTHAYMNTDGSLIQSHQYGFLESEQDPSNTGQQLWDKLISKHKNIFLVFCGHTSPNDVVRRVDLGEHGNEVHQILVDATQLDRGDFTYSKGAGMILHMKFSNNGTKLSCNYYSAFYNKFFRPENQFTIELDPDGLVYDSNHVTYLVDGKEAEVSSVVNNEYILTEGDISVSADNSEQNRIITAIYNGNTVEEIQHNNSQNTKFSLSSAVGKTIKTFVWSGNDKIQPTTLPFTLKRENYAKVTFNGAEEATVTMRNTVTNKTYREFASVPYGFYEYYVQQEGYVSQTGFVSIEGDRTIEVTLTPDSTKHSFSFSDPQDGFTVLSSEATSTVLSDGINLSHNNNGYIENNTLELNVNNRKKIAITYKNPSSYINLRVQFKPQGSEEWSTYTGILNGHCKDYTTTVFDMSNVPGYAGVMEGIRISLATGLETNTDLELQSISFIAENTVNFVDVGEMIFECNQNGALIQLYNTELDRSYAMYTSDGVADFGEMLPGMYEYSVYKTGFDVQKGTIDFKTDTAPLVVSLVADNDIANYTWDFQDSVDGFSNSSKTATVTNDNGSLVINITGTDPYVYATGINKTLDNRKMLIIRYKNATSYGGFSFYYITSESGSWVSTGKTIPSNMATFENLYLDMSDMESWNGTLQQMRIDPIDGVNNISQYFYVDSIEIVNVNAVNY